MLTRYEQKLLKYCSKHNDEDNFYASVNIESDFFKTFNQNELYEVCVSLHEKGYISEMDRNIVGDIQFSLSHNGMHYKEVSWLEIKDFLTKSIITPIIVSLITSLITFFLFSQY